MSIFKREHEATKRIREMVDGALKKFDNNINGAQELLDLHRTKNSDGETSVPGNIQDIARTNMIGANLQLSRDLHDIADSLSKTKL